MAEFTITVIPPIYQHKDTWQKMQQGFIFVTGLLIQHGGYGLGLSTRSQQSMVEWPRQDGYSALLRGHTQSWIYHQSRVTVALLTG